MVSILNININQDLINQCSQNINYKLKDIYIYIYIYIYYKDYKQYNFTYFNKNIF